MESQKTLIFVGAHPDDESFSAGATLAHYAAKGVKVYYICATRGEVGQANPEKMKDYTSVSQLRCAELKSAAEVLGLTDVLYLDYRDSGMAGWKDNKHPNALVSAPLEEVTGRIVEIFRKLKPDVVITFDPVGGSHHPDHIVTQKATVKAFYASGDEKQYPEAGKTFQPKKLYFCVYPLRLLRIIVKVLTFFGRDTSIPGRNKNIDVAGWLSIKYPVHAVIRTTKKAVEAKEEAIFCHESMIDENKPSFNILNFIERTFGYKDCFMREYPKVKSIFKEHDLFKGIK